MVKGLWLGLPKPVFRYWGVMCLSACPLAAQGYQDDLKVKVETEFRIPLTAEGYYHMLATWEFGGTAYREDTYVELFDGHDFLLREGNLPIKARFMESHKKMKWQVTRTQKVEQLRTRFLRASLKQTERKALSEKDFPGLGKAHSRSLDLLEDMADLRVKRSAVDRTALTLESLAPVTDLLRFALGGLAPEGTVLLPAEFAKKDRHVEILEIEGLEVELVLGRNLSRGPNGSSFEEHEIEADIAGPLTEQARQAFYALAKRLEETGLRADHIDQADVDRFAFARFEYTRLMDQLQPGAARGGKCARR